MEHPTPKVIVSYAQNYEDIILSGFFEPDEKGFYVDVGANDAVHDSTTKYFYDRGWYGINVEPLQQYYEELKRERPRDTTLQLGVSDEPGTLELREYVNGTGLSTFSKSLQETYSDTDETTADHIDHTVKVMTLAAIFKAQETKTINFMKVDVEGYEYHVLAGNDWKLYRPEVLCIEANHVENDWRLLLRENKYDFVFFDGLNEYYVARERADRAQKFSYVQTMIMQGTAVKYQIAEKLTERESLLVTRRDLEAEIALKNQYIASLERTISQITPLRRHFKRQLKGHVMGIDGRIVAKLSGTRQYVPKVVHDKDDPATVTLNDQENFAAYAVTQQAPRRLQLYRWTRSKVFRTANKILRVGRV